MRSAGRRANAGAGAAVLVLTCVAMLVFSGCSAGSAENAQPRPAATTTATPTPAPQPTLTVADIATSVADAEWSFAPDGLGEPFTVTLTGGIAADEYGRQFSLGAAVASDADGDGIIDAAIPISMVDGNALHELWYIWLGRGGGAPPEQVIYPIGRTTRCGDITHSVTSVAGGFEMQVRLRMPHTDDQRSCAEGGTGDFTRVVSVAAFEGAYYPVQSAPVIAWGGVCPPTTWLDSEAQVGIAGRAAPPASATPAIDASRPVAAFAVGEAPLVTASGVSFFGFIQDPVEGAAVKMHCAFGS